MSDTNEEISLLKHETSVEFSINNNDDLSVDEVRLTVDAEVTQFRRDSRVFDWITSELTIGQKWGNHATISFNDSEQIAEFIDKLQAFYQDFQSVETAYVEAMKKVEDGKIV